jgi:hypothetical protein
MTLRQRVARDLSRLSTDAKVRASLDMHPEFLGLTVTHALVVGSKEQADRVAAAAGIPTMWRNGYYMAAKEFGQVLVELHFVPLITEDREGNTGCASGTG